MPRKCKICNHQKAKTINSQLVGGRSYRKITEQFGMEVGSVSRHVNNCLKLDAQTLQERIKTGNAIDHHALLAGMLEHALKHQRAAARWLEDPDNPDEFTVEPRADEIQVVYSYFRDDKPVREKAKLQDLIYEFKEQRPEWIVDAVNINTADLRDHSLKTLDKIDMVADKFAKVQGLYTDNKPNEAAEAYQTVKTLAEQWADDYGTSVEEQLQWLVDNRKDLAPALKARIVSELEN